MSSFGFYFVFVSFGSKFNSICTFQDKIRKIDTNSLLYCNTDLYVPTFQIKFSWKTQI